MKATDSLYGQNWIGQMQDAYANGVLCSDLTPQSIELCLIQRHERPCDLIMHINWWRLGETMGNVWHRRYAETTSDGYINILMR